MHYDIECYYNDMEVENEEDCVEFDYFQLLKETMVQTRTVSHRVDGGIRLAISRVYRYDIRKPNGHLSLYDWKRCKEIKKQTTSNATTKCIEHLPNSNYWHYSLQLNTYKYLLEKL